MKTLIAATAVAASVLVSSAAMAGPCTYTWQTAKDGSSCGGRASTVRPGGR